MSGRFVYKFICITIIVIVDMLSARKKKVKLTSLKLQNFLESFGRLLDSVKFVFILISFILKSKLYI